MTNDTKLTPAIIIIRHAMDGAGPTPVPDATFNSKVTVTVDDKTFTKPIQVEGSFLCPKVGTNVPPAVAIALPKLIEKYNLQPVSNVLTILPPVTKEYERTPNPFMTIKPYVDVLSNSDTSKFPDGKLTFSLYSSHNFDTGDKGKKFSADKLLEDGFSTVIAWEKTEMWASVEHKHTYDSKLILGSLAADGYDYITSPQPVKGTSLYVYSGTVVDGRLPVKKYDLKYSDDPTSASFEPCGGGDAPCTTQKLTCP